MAKKAVATLRQKGATKGMAKVIKMVKSDKSGAYTFVEDVVSVEDANNFFAN
jgi:hypothetical protein